MKFINQTRIITEILAMIESCHDGNNFNIVLQGPAGCGKTLLARKICLEATNENYSFQIPVKGQINFNCLPNYRFHIIDEIHEFKTWELLYPYLDIGDKTFIFGTTEYGELPDPFLSRCIRFTFDPYSIDDLSKIVKEYAMKRRYRFDDEESYRLISVSARGSPRIAKQRLDRIKLLLNTNGYPKSREFVEFLLNKIGIFENGYTSEDVKYLSFLSKINASSLMNLSRAIQLDKNTIEKEIEPYLIENGNIQITSKGRKFIKWPFTMMPR